MTDQLYANTEVTLAGDYTLEQGAQPGVLYARPTKDGPNTHLQDVALRLYLHVGKTPVAEQLRQWADVLNEAADDAEVALHTAEATA